MVSLWIIAACAVHVGRPPTVSRTYSVLAVHAPVPEPDLPDALSRATAGALSARGALGPEIGVNIEVLDASVRAEAGAGASRVYRARLEAAWQVLGPSPRRLVLSAERSYVVALDAADLGTVSGAAARASAFDALARELSEDAAEWILYGGER